MTARFSRAAVFLRIFCAAALLSLGLGHLPAVAAAPLDAYDEIYRLPDGAFADICSESERGHHMPAVKPICEVCRLVASVLLPTPGDNTWLLGRRVSLENPLRPFFDSPGTKTVDRPKSRAPPAAA